MAQAARHATRLRLAAPVVNTKQASSHVRMTVWTPARFSEQPASRVVGVLRATGYSDRIGAARAVESRLVGSPPQAPPARLELDERLVDLLWHLAAQFAGRHPVPRHHPAPASSCVETSYSFVRPSASVAAAGVVDNLLGRSSWWLLGGCSLLGIEIAGIDLLVAPGRRGCCASLGRSARRASRSRSSRTRPWRHQMASRNGRLPRRVRCQAARSWSAPTACWAWHSGCSQARADPRRGDQHPARPAVLGVRLDRGVSFRNGPDLHEIADECLGPLGDVLLVPAIMGTLQQPPVEHEHVMGLKPGPPACRRRCRETNGSRHRASASASANAAASHARWRRCRAGRADRRGPDGQSAIRGHDLPVLRAACRALPSAGICPPARTRTAAPPSSSSGQYQRCAGWPARASTSPIAFADPVLLLRHDIAPQADGTQPDCPGEPPDRRETTRTGRPPHQRPGTACPWPAPSPPAGLVHATPHGPHSPLARSLGPLVA